MNRPIPIAAFAEDQRRWCRWGTIAQQPRSLRRGCQPAAIWRRETTRTSDRTTPSQTYAVTVKARLFARAAALLQIFSKGAES